MLTMNIMGMKIAKLAQVMMLAPIIAFSVVPILRHLIRSFNASHSH